MKRLFAWFLVACGAAGILVLGALSIRRGEPTLLSPCAFSVAMPALWLAEWFTGTLLPYRSAVVLLFSGLPVSLIYVAWSSPLLGAAKVVPRRSLMLLAVVVVLTVVCAIASWRSGLHYYGLRYTAYITGAAAVALTVLAALGAWARKSPSFAKNYVFHTLLFAWLAWGAFPLLGELP